MDDERIRIRAYFHNVNRTGERWWDQTSNWIQAEREESAGARGPLTGLLMRTIWSRMVKDGVVFRVGWEGLARHFMKDFFHGNVYRASIAELRACYLSIPGAITDRYRRRRRQGGARGSHKDAPEIQDASIPEDADGFGRFIGEEVLELREPPRDTLARVYKEASEDLALIETHISECQRLAQENGGQLKRGSRLRGRTEQPDEDNVASDKASWVQIANYYADLNHEAREEIVSFLTHRIHDEALRLAHKPWFNSFDFRVPYSFRFWPNRYHPRQFSDVENKFRSESIPVWEDWCHCYEHDREEFYTRLRSYLDAMAPTRSMRDQLNEHHRLNARSGVLISAFDAYDAEQWEAFATLAVAQIEGLFLDYCEDLGVPQTELQRSSLPVKLSAILRQKDHFPDYAYYAFRFPVIRNHLAHGRLLTDEAANQARLLLLDLRDVMVHVMDVELDVNALVNRLREAARVTPLRVEDALAMLYFKDKKPPAFYCLDRVWSDLSDLADTDECATLAAKVATSLIDERWDDESSAVLCLLRDAVLHVCKRTDRKQRWSPVRQTIQSELDERQKQKRPDLGIHARSKYWCRIDTCASTK